MKKLILTVVFAVVLAGGLMAAMSSIISASPALAHTCTTTTC